MNSAERKCLTKVEETEVKKSSGKEFLISHARQSRKHAWCVLLTTDPPLLSSLYWLWRKACRNHNALHKQTGTQRQNSESNCFLAGQTLGISRWLSVHPVWGFAHCFHRVPGTSKAAGFCLSVVEKQKNIDVYCGDVAEASQGEPPASCEGGAVRPGHGMGVNVARFGVRRVPWISQREGTLFCHCRAGVYLVTVLFYVEFLSWRDISVTRFNLDSITAKDHFRHLIRDSIASLCVIAHHKSLTKKSLGKVCPSSLIYSCNLRLQLLHCSLSGDWLRWRSNLVPFSLVFISRRHPARILPRIFAAFKKLWDPHLLVLNCWLQHTEFEMSYWAKIVGWFGALDKSKVNILFCSPCYRQRWRDSLRKPAVNIHRWPKAPVRENNEAIWIVPTVFFYSSTRMSAIKGQHHFMWRRVASRHLHHH